MLELILIWRFAVRIGSSAAGKGLKKLPYQVMLVVLWVSGELAGAALAQILFVGQDAFWQTYLVALAGAALGAAIAFLIIRLVPAQETVAGSLQPAPTAQDATVKGFARSMWIPVIAIVLAIMCVCTSSGGGVLILSLRQTAQNISASNPQIGTEIGSDGRITRPLTEIPYFAKMIYFGFDLNVPSETDTQVTFDWYTGGKAFASFTTPLRGGNVVGALDCRALGITELSRGKYEVRARMGGLELVSAQFTVR